MRTRRASRAGALATLVLAALASAGCSIPTQGAPSVIPPSHVCPSACSTSTRPRRRRIPPSVYVPVKVFFFGPTNQLQSVQRNVPTPAPLTAILAAMLAGPSKSEAAGGIATAIPNDVEVISATANPTNGSVVTVNMNTAFGAITGNNAEEAVAQVVATVAAAYGPSTGVLFEIAGNAPACPLPTARSRSGPVYLLQFAGVTPDRLWRQPAFSTSRCHATRGAPDQRCSRS